MTRFLSASITDVGKKRKLNEDSLLDRSDLGLWAVADGMGGHEAGEVASARTVELLADLSPGGSVEAAAREAERLIQQANADLLEMAWGGDRPQTIGTTIAALVLRDNQFACLWAGDSRCYLVRDRNIHRLTQDHSLVNDLVRSGMLDEKDAATHPDSNVITRAVGASEQLDVDMVKGNVKGGDLFLAVSDGVTRKLDDSELCQILLRSNPGQAADEIKRLVLERGAPDNLTAIVVRVLP